MKIHFADPGGTTGWAEFEWDGDSLVKPELTDFGQVAGEDYPAFLNERLRDPSIGIDKVGYERFRIYKGTIGPKASPVIEQIGQIKMVCELSETPYFSQPPSKKTFFEKKLVALGYYKPGKQHARDAISHALYFFLAMGSEGSTPEWVLVALKDDI